MSIVMWLLVFLVFGAIIRIVELEGEIKRLQEILKRHNLNKFIGNALDRDDE